MTGTFNRRLSSFAGNPVYVAKYLELALPLGICLVIWYRKWYTRLSLGLFCISCLTALILTGARGSWIGIFCSVVLISLIFDKRALIVLVIVCCLTPFIATKATVRRAQAMFDVREYLKSDAKAPLTFRVTGWQAALSMIRDYPLLGVGYGKRSYARLFEKYKQHPDVEKWAHAHNTFLQVAVETGLLGLAVFVWLVATIFYHGLATFFRLTKSYEKSTLCGIVAGLSALVIHGQITHFYKLEIALLLWVVVGILFTIVHNCQKAMIGMVR